MMAPPPIPGRDVSALLQKAATAWKQQEYQLSIGLLEQASRLSPGDPRVQLHLGRCHGLCYDYVAADRCFEKVLQLTGKKESFVAIGLQYLGFGQPEKAARYFERALKETGDSVEILVRLAEIRERQGGLDDAGDLIQRALQSQPAFRPALLARARLERQHSRLTNAETMVRDLLRASEADPLLRSQAEYELGIILDRQGRFDEAMSAFIDAKALVPVTAEKKISREAAHSDIRKTVETISAALLQRWQETAEKFKPHRRLAVLCGHPRSGTTLLEQILDSHPEIISMEETSIFFEEIFLPLGRNAANSTHFLPVLDALRPGQLRQSRTNYFRLAERFLGQTIGARLLIDKNPSLLALVPALLRVFPEIKFLVAIRDPRDVCLSCFMQPLFATHRLSATYQTLETTVTDYSLTMGLWQALKPLMPTSFLEVHYEDMVSNLEPVARRTLDYLGLPWSDRIREFQKHAATRVVRSPTYADVRKPVTSQAVGRWRNYQKYLEPHLSQLEPLVKAFGYD
jgi:Flp pilus assembly protein TadD